MADPQARPDADVSTWRKRVVALVVAEERAELARQAADNHQAFNPHPFAPYIAHAMRVGTKGFVHPN